jgi:hypothetical protein
MPPRQYESATVSQTEAAPEEKFKRKRAEETYLCANPESTFLPSRHGTHRTGGGHPGQSILSRSTHVCGVGRRL